MKFQQFWYADIGLGKRAFVAAIGFLAAWWVGFAIAWFLARRLVPGQPRGSAYRQVALAFAIVLGCGALSTFLGFVLGLWRGPDADYSAWSGICSQLQVVDTWSFVRVAYIHNASYIGGAIGLIIALVTVRPRPRSA